MRFKSVALSIPDELSADAVERMTFGDGEWRLVYGFYCKSCGSNALANPYRDDIFGCRPCGVVVLPPRIFRYFRGSLHNMPNGGSLANAFSRIAVDSFDD